MRMEQMQMQRSEQMEYEERARAAAVAKAAFLAAQARVVHRVVYYHHNHYHIKTAYVNKTRVVAVPVIKKKAIKKAAVHTKIVVKKFTGKSKSLLKLESYQKDAIAASLAYRKELAFINARNEARYHTYILKISATRKVEMAKREHVLETIQ